MFVVSIRQFRDWQPYSPSLLPYTLLSDDKHTCHTITRQQRTLGLLGASFWSSGRAVVRTRNILKKLGPLSRDRWSGIRHRRCYKKYPTAWQLPGDSHNHNTALYFFFMKKRKMHFLFFIQLCVRDGGNFVENHDNNTTTRRTLCFDRACFLRAVWCLFVCVLVHFFFFVRLMMTTFWQADEYTYWNFFLDWGPLSLGSLYRFCRKLNNKLRDDRLLGKVRGSRPINL